MPTQLGTFAQGYTSDRIFFSYHECKKCNLRYCPRYFSQAQLNSLYSRQSENTFEASIGARAKTQQGYVDILSQHSMLTGHYLEIGCDIGLFTDHCSRRWNFDKLWLYEPNLDVHPQLAARLANAPYVLSFDRFAADQVPAGSISLAVAIHVVDHLLEPRRMLAELHKCLAPDGILFAVVHDCSSALARLMGRRWPPHTLQHPQLFTPHTMNSMLRETGFEPIAITKTYNFFSLAYLTRGLLSIAGLKFASRLNFPSPTIGLRLGNIAVVARKPR